MNLQRSFSLNEIQASMQISISENLQELSNSRTFMYMSNFFQNSQKVKPTFFLENA